MGLGKLVGAYGSKPSDMPLPKTYGQIGQQNMDMQAGWMPSQLNYERSLRPQWQNVNESSLGSQVFGGAGGAGYINMAGQAGQQSLGQQEMLGGGQLSMMGRLQGAARNAYMSPMMQQAQTSMFNTANQYASGQLSQQDRFMAGQAANSAMASRGLTGRQGVAANVLGNYGMSQDRIMQGQKMLQGVYGNEAGISGNIANLTMSGYDQMKNAGSLMTNAGNTLGQYNSGVMNPRDQMGFDQEAARYKADVSNRLAQQKWKAGMWSAAGDMVDDGLNSAFGGFG
jgi:hypothetical protein